MGHILEDTSYFLCISTNSIVDQLLKDYYFKLHKLVTCFPPEKDDITIRKIPGQRTPRMNSKVGLSNYVDAVYTNNTILHPNLSSKNTIMILYTSPVAIQASESIQPPSNIQNIYIYYK